MREMREMRETMFTPNANVIFVYATEVAANS